MLINPLNIIINENELEFADLYFRNSYAQSMMKRNGIRNPIEEDETEYNENDQEFDHFRLGV